MIRTKTNSSNAQDGFTIVELMIASAVFSLILLLCTTGLLQITRTYYKGITGTKTQQTARAITDQISQSIQFGGGTVIGTSASTVNAAHAFCIGNQRYSYRLDNELIETSPDSSKNQQPHVFVVDTSTCSGDASSQDLTKQPPNLTNGSRELMAPSMRLSKLQVTNVPGTSLWQIDVSVISGDDDLLNSSHDQCAASRFGTQFCAQSTLSTVVQKRINSL